MPQYTIRRCWLSAIRRSYWVPSIASWVHTDVKGWTLAEIIDDGQYRALLDAAEQELQQFVGADGTVRFPHPALIISAHKTRPS